MVGPLKSFFLLSCILSCIGCGSYQNQVKTWPCAFFIDSLKVGIVGLQYVETYPRFGESYAEYSDIHTNIWSCSKNGDGLVQEIELTPTLNITTCFVAYPFLWVDDDPGTCINTHTMQLDVHNLTVSADLAFSWNWKYYFYENGSSRDTNFIYDATTNRVVATFNGKIPINFDRDGSRILLLNTSGLEYYTMADSSISKIASKKNIILKDYRYGQIALTMLDSNTFYSMVPDFDTLPDALSRVQWFDKQGKINFHSTVFNLKSGDYVSVDAAGTVIVGNFIDDKVLELVKSERVAIQ